MLPDTVGQQIAPRLTVYISVSTVFCQSESLGVGKVDLPSLDGARLAVFSLPPMFVKIM